MACSFISAAFSNVHEVWGYIVALTCFPTERSSKLHSRKHNYDNFKVDTMSTVGGVGYLATVDTYRRTCKQITIDAAEDTATYQPVINDLSE